MARTNRRERSPGSHVAEGPIWFVILDHSTDSEQKKNKVVHQTAERAVSMDEWPADATVPSFGPRMISGARPAMNVVEVYRGLAIGSAL